jgi:5-methylthioadenosine/S-adenosylhomocysteine deaminase
MALRDEYRGDPLICTHFASPAPSAVDDTTLLRMRRLADELEIPVAMPLHASRDEVEQNVAKHGQRPLARLAQLGLASPLLVAVHATQVDPSDRETLAAAGATVVHCPESDLRRAQGVCPVPALRASGVRVALGADGAASASAADMFAEMHCAGLLIAASHATPGAPGARDLLRMATLEGARALGLGDIIGSLVPGKWADLCCIDLRMPRSWPVYDVPAALVHATASSQVTDTWVAGRHVLADGTLRYVDESSVLDRAEAWRARIAAGHETENETHALPR